MKALVTITDNTIDSKEFLVLNNLTIDSRILVKLNEDGDITPSDNSKFDFGVIRYLCAFNRLPEFIVILTKEE